jgi:hypothetical protein
MEEIRIPPETVITEAQDFLRSRRDDNLEDFAHHAKSITDTITHVESELEKLALAKRDKNTNKTERDILAVRIAKYQDMKRKLTSTRSELATRLSDFRNKTVGALNTTRIRAAAKNPTRRNIWKPALTKNLQRFPSEVQKKAQSAKMYHTKARWQPALEDMKDVLTEPSVELQRDAAEKFIRKHQPNWAAKLTGDVQYRTELLDVFLGSVNALTTTESN